MSPYAFFIHFKRYSLFSLLIFLFFTAKFTWADPFSLQGEIRSRLMSTKKNAALFGNQTAQNPKEASPMEAFYTRRNFQPFWVDSAGLTANGARLTSILSTVEVYGGNFEDYNFICLQLLLEKIKQDNAPRKNIVNILADLEFMLTRALKLYVQHQLQGKVSPESLYEEWIADKPLVDMDAFFY